MPLHITKERRVTPGRVEYPTSRGEIDAKRLRTIVAILRPKHAMAKRTERGDGGRVRKIPGAAGEARARARGERSDGARARRGDRNDRVACVHAGWCG